MLLFCRRYIELLEIHQHHFSHKLIRYFTWEDRGKSFAECDLNLLSTHEDVVMASQDQGGGVCQSQSEGLQDK